MPLAVTVASVAQSLRSEDRCTIHLLTTGFTKEDRRRVEAFDTKIRPKFNWVQVNEEPLSSIPRKGRYPLSAYYRLLLPTLLPAGINRVIYLDTDIVVCAPISTLAATNLNGAVIGAASATSCPWLASSSGLSRWRELGLSPKSPYFNSGVLVLDIDAWRKEELSKKVLDFLASQPEAPRFADQDALNAIFANCWHRLDPAWNQVSSVHLDHGLVHCNLDISEVNRIRNEPKIIHFTGRLKPWRSPRAHPMANRWHEVLETTARRGWRPPKQSRLLPMIRKFRKWIEYIEARLERKA